MPRFPVPSNRTLRIVWTVVGLLVVAGVVVLTIVVLDLLQSREVGRDDRADMRQQLVETQERLDDQRAASEALAGQVEALGEVPIIEPRDASDRLPNPGALTPPPASPFAVLAAVQEQIEPALRRVCGGDCKGEDGDSIRGEPGESIQGPPGESITGPRGEPGQSITGPKGDTGERGRAGADAPRITFIQCEGIAPFTLTFGLDDGTTHEVECGYLEPIPEPTP